MPISAGRVAVTHSKSPGESSGVISNSRGKATPDHPTVCTDQKQQHTAPWFTSVMAAWAVGSAVPVLLLLLLLPHQLAAAQASDATAPAASNDDATYQYTPAAA